VFFHAKSSSFFLFLRKQTAIEKLSISSKLIRKKWNQQGALVRDSRKVPESGKDA
jgi:hypothetical protein